MSAMEEKEIFIGDPDLPPEIRSAILEMAPDDYRIFQVPTDQGVEWWLWDEDGELIEGFWLERRRGWLRGLLQCLFW
ncbi:MAG: hypothetical protein ACU837_05865 [Gammaproteobacteria bacterium]